MKPLALALTIVGACNTEDPPPDASFKPETCAELAPLRPQGTVRRPDGSNLTASGLAADPSILLEDGLYRMWFTSVSDVAGTPNLHVAYAESRSREGLVVDRVIDPVLSPDIGGGETGIETVSVARGPNGLVMLYTADQPGDVTWKIGMATSQDGIAWTKHPVPVLDASLPWEMPVCVDPPACTVVTGGVLEPSLLYEAGEFRLWYAAVGALDGRVAFRIGTARSLDGITWTREPDPVFEPASRGFDDLIVSHPSVVAFDGGYHLFYFGSSAADELTCAMMGGCNLTPGKIGHATSTDGIRWTRDDELTLAPTGSGPGSDAWSVGGPAAIRRSELLIDNEGAAPVNDEIAVWYFGASSPDAAEVHIGVVSTTCI